MRHDRPTDLGRLQSGEWQKVQQAAELLEAAWNRAPQGGQPPDLARFLPPPADPLRVIILHELIKTDLEICWRKGQPTSLENYAHACPNWVLPANCRLR